jgi:DMSO reductase anchor subunit
MPHPTMCCTAPSLVLAPGLGVIYNARVIALAHAIMTVLTYIFFVGIAGSLLVILISFFEDLNELVGKE